MKKILGMIAILALCAATARAAPAVSSANAQLGQGSLTDHNTNNVADSNFVIMYHNTALFMGDEDDGLLKGPHSLALTCVNTKATTAQLEANDGSATEVVNPANAGKTNTAIHTPPTNLCGLMIIAS